MKKDPNEKRIILASGSARRKEILEAHGVAPVVMPMDVDETLPEGISPTDAVMYLALKKGLACRESLVSRGEEEAYDAIISSDTIVYAKDVTNRTPEHPDGTPSIFGKPRDNDDAWRMLTSISSNAHEVITGVAFFSLDSSSVMPPVTCLYDITKVYVKETPEEDLKAYLDSGEPFGKAGGYAIQMGFGDFIDHIDGDFENVVGFPFYRIADMLFR